MQLEPSLLGCEELHESLMSESPHNNSYLLKNISAFWAPSEDVIGARNTVNSRLTADCPHFRLIEVHQMILDGDSLSG